MNVKYYLTRNYRVRIEYDTTTSRYLQVRPCVKHKNKITVMSRKKQKRISIRRTLQYRAT